MQREKYWLLTHYANEKLIIFFFLSYKLCKCSIVYWISAFLNLDKSPQLNSFEFYNYCPVIIVIEVNVVRWYSINEELLFLTSAFVFIRKEKRVIWLLVKRYTFAEVLIINNPKDHWTINRLEKINTNSEIKIC